MNLKQVELLIVGGDDEREAGHVEIFNDYTEEWRVFYNFIVPQGRFGFSVVIFREDLVVIGGIHEYIDDHVFSLSLTTKKMASMGFMNSPRAFCTATVINDMIYISGGYDAEYNPLSSAERFNPITKTWEIIPSMKNVRYNHGAVTYENKLYVFGGYSGKKYLAEAEVYDPETNEWSDLPQMIIPKSHFGITVVEDKAYMISGLSTDDYVKGIEIFDFKTQTYEFLKNLEHCTTLCGNRTVNIGGLIYCFANMRDYGYEFDPRPGALKWRWIDKYGRERHNYNVLVIPDHIKVLRDD